MIQAAIDTNILIALIDEGDTWHQRAVVICKALEKANAQYVYFDSTVNEVVSVLARRLEEKGQSDKLEPLLVKLEEIVPEEKITWISQEIKRVYRDILELVKSSRGKLNFHDALMVHILRERKVRYIVSFDRDFDEIEGLVRIHTGQVPPNSSD
jgi:predicted nucleic acid-binding protein